MCTIHATPHPPRLPPPSHPPQPPPPPVDIDAHVRSLNEKVPELDAKIAACDKELGEIKQQLARLRPAQQGALKQRALGVLKRKKIYEQQRGQTQQRAFNLEQTQYAIESTKGAYEHVAVSASRVPVPVGCRRRSLSLRRVPTRPYRAAFPPTPGTCAALLPPATRRRSRRAPPSCGWHKAGLIWTSWRTCM